MAHFCHKISAQDGQDERDEEVYDLSAIHYIGARGGVVG
jgi:hypothetical protein